jgi:hypothetical protein
LAVSDRASLLVVELSCATATPPAMLSAPSATAVSFVIAFI